MPVDVPHSCPYIQKIYRAQYNIYMLIDEFKRQAQGQLYEREMDLLKGIEAETEIIGNAITATRKINEALRALAEKVDLQATERIEEGRLLT